jgi:hypothetical protein
VGTASWSDPGFVEFWYPTKLPAIELSAKMLHIPFGMRITDAYGRREAEKQWLAALDC